MAKRETKKEQAVKDTMATYYCPHCNIWQNLMATHKSQTRICPYCGSRMYIDSDCKGRNNANKE